ncbi:IS1/IS6 family transposase [Candidatus Woesearchaeota archaeon]|nr:IS1/IS6 family transposase [Candidatus Woesearchaeota archaeon]
MPCQEQIKPQRDVKTSDNKKPSICLFCKSQNTVKKGFIKTEHRGNIQRYICKDCKRSFCIDEGFYRMRNNENKITKAIDLYFSNLSSRKVRNTFKRHEETKISHVSVLDWCRRYALKVWQYVDSLAPKLGGKCYADETEIDCEQRNDIFWCSVDWDTRFISATLYSPTEQDTDDAIEFFEKIKAKGKPKYIQTDAAQFYPRAFNKVFYSNKGKREDLTQHRVVNTSRTGKYNVRIETVFSKIKDRVEDFRGLKALWSAPILLAGIILQHNFIEAHTTTGEIPCELAGLQIETGINRWLGMIRLTHKLIN